MRLWRITSAVKTLHGCSPKTNDTFITENAAICHKVVKVWAVNHGNIETTAVEAAAMKMERAEAASGSLPLHSG